MILFSSAAFCLPVPLVFGKKKLAIKVGKKLQIPPIGLGTWITFNVGNSADARAERTAVMKEFFAQGGGMIDSSPMYGSSEAVVGHGLKVLGFPSALFSATKVWTSSTKEGEAQLKDSFRLWGVKKFDLVQVHNLVNWQEHLRNLFTMKEKGLVKYVGVTTSHGRRHSELKKIMREQPIDFIQVTYNIQDREVEKEILPLAQERKIAVIANRPYGGGALIDRAQKAPLPAWASEAGCSNWPELLLKFIISHPAITCAIPATTKLEHLRENMLAREGKFPDPGMREKMAKHFLSL